jgi:hypothetical protein
MKKWILGISIAALFGPAATGAGRAFAAPAKPEQRVTIRGCVRAGTEAGTFMLMRVTEVRPGGAAEHAVPVDEQGQDVLYSLSSNQNLKAQDGRRVEVRGTIDPSDPKEGETKVSEDSSQRLDSKSEVKFDGDTVTVKTDSQPQVDPTTTKDTLTKHSGPERDRVVYRLKVSSIKRVAGTCQ